jgi:hypothetical protein
MNAIYKSPDPTAVNQDTPLSKAELQALMKRLADPPASLPLPEENRLFKRLKMPDSVRAQLVHSHSQLVIQHAYAHAHAHAHARAHAHFVCLSVSVSCVVNFVTVFHLIHCAVVSGSCVPDVGHVGVGVEGAGVGAAGP